VGAKDFCPNFPKLARKVFCANFAYTFFPTKIMTTFSGVTSKKMVFMCFSANVVRNFLKSNNAGCHLAGFSGTLPRFSGIFPGFSGIFPGFSGIFPRFLEILPGFLTNQYFWGCACTPCTPVSYTTMLQDVGNSIRYSRNESSVNGFMLAGCYEWQKVQQNIKLKDSKPLFRCSYD